MNESNRKISSEEPQARSQDDSIAVDISQPVLEVEVVFEEEGVIEVDGVIVDEGYQSALDGTTCKKSLVQIEESYKQQIKALKFTSQKNHIDKHYHVKNELTNDEKNFFKGKVANGIFILQFLHLLYSFLQPLQLHTHLFKCF